jgi:hypothetical protein
MIINDLFNNKKQDVAEGRFVRGPGGVPLDRQGRPVAPKAPKAEPMRMRQWVVHHEGQRGEGGEMIIDAPNFETAWELANEYDLDIIDIKPVKGVAEGSKMARADKSAKAPKPKDQQEYDAVEKYRKDLAQSYNKEPNFGIKDDEEENKWWIDYDLDEGVAEGSLEEDKGMTGYNAFKREWRAKHGADAKVPAYDSKEYTSYVYRQNDKKQGVAEVSQQTLQSYRKKASAQKRAADDVVSGDADDETWKKNVSLSAKRRQGIDAANKRLGVAEDDGFDVVSNYADMRTTDTGNKSNQTYTSTTIQKNPATGQQKSLAKWDHTDPKTGKNYSGSNYIDAQGNAEVQKNYEESKNKVNEVSLGDYRKKAMMSKAMAQTNKFFDRDNPAKVAAADRTIANRTKGLAGADARRKPYTQPPVDQDKQRRDLADKYPNIDELVRQAELNRDPDYDRAEGNAYYAGRDAEHNYHRLKQIQRMIRGAELDEMNFGGVSQTTDSDTGDVTTSFNQGPISVSQTKTPGGYTKQTDQRFDLGPATMAQKTVGPNIGAGQLAGTTTRTATNNMTGQSQQQVRGVGFGGATGANVGKNYVGSSDDDLAQHAASVFKENVDLIKHLAGVKPVR